MPLEDLQGSNRFISHLDESNPIGAESKSQGDDHLRGIKNVLKNTFPNLTQAAEPTAVELNRIVGLSSNLQEKLDAIDQAILEANAIASKSTPTGSILAFAGSAPPEGFSLCDGGLLSRSGFASLFSVIGTESGAGDGTTTFNKPDLRGWFVRGLDSSSGRTLGSEELDDLKAHQHSMVFERDRGSVVENNAVWGDANVFGTSQQETTLTGGTETRPKNKAFNYIIKL